ncbi:CopG family transcriptional regulator [uncultured Castellaniella sp.]|jgi:predicted transcriptional regulator|uniref:CopG family transcriptional regulator n=1 Tax=uncultured Castellaniella sp. TaxID=647907 RepID=UPI002604F3D9|nr:CopG family transcriptional regulator [uncultured Castellaniella sp.]
MTTTSLKLSEALKARAIHAARELGMTPHAFMVSAIEQAAVSTEQRAQFLEQAKAARQQMLDTGLGYAADDVHAYLRERAAGAPAKRPKAHPWRP